MRKQIINRDQRQKLPKDQSWLDVQSLAQVELTSEDAQHPIEAAFFDAPQRIKRIQLIFSENQQPRTQEFVLGWSSDAGESYRELVRQQYNFSPPAATEEVEDYTFDLADVKSLELKIIPDISGGEARASVEQFRVG